MYAIRLKQKVNGKYHYFYRSNNYSFSLFPDGGQTWIKKPNDHSKYCFGACILTHLLFQLDDGMYNNLNCDFDLIKELGIVLPSDFNQWPNERQLFNDLLEIVVVEFKEV